MTVCTRLGPAAPRARLLADGPLSETRFPSSLAPGGAGLRTRKLCPSLPRQLPSCSARSLPCKSGRVAGAVFTPSALLPPDHGQSRTWVLPEAGAPLPLREPVGPMQFPRPLPQSSGCAQELAGCSPSSPPTPFALWKKCWVSVWKPGQSSPRPWVSICLFWGESFPRECCQERTFQMLYPLGCSSSSLW